MNEFTAKKLGEVLAFAEVGKETWLKGQTALESVFEEERVAEVITANGHHAEIIRSMAEENSVSEIVLKKLEGTGTKLRQMRDLYVGDQWDNPTELLEWSGFFEGAAVVHWSLVGGAGEASGKSDMQSLAETGKDFHEDLLSSAIDLLHETGKKKAS